MKTAGCKIGDQVRALVPFKNSYVLVTHSCP